jgi:acetyl esterase/lipase
MRALAWGWAALGLLLLAGCLGIDDDDADDDAADDDAADDDAGDDDSGDDDGGDDDSGDDDAGDDDTAPSPLPEIEIPCTDSLADVYVTPGNLPPWGPSVLGDVVRCAEEDDLSVTQVQTRLDLAGVEGVTAFAGVTRVKIAYRTTRWAGVEGVGTARVYLPDTHHPEGPMPVIVVTHGTTGLSDLCAPSVYESISDYLALPFAGQGFVVVAPDYAGLGNEGVQGYGDNADTGHSVLDAARALRDSVTPGSMAPGVIVGGHSQGGGAALSAHAFGGSYGDGDILGVIPFAPGWSFETEGLWGVSHYPGLVIWTGIGSAVTALALYADAANHVGPGHETDYFVEDIRADVATAIENECVFTLMASIQSLGVTYADTMDPTFVQTLADCTDGLPSCGPPGEGYLQRVEANIVSADPAMGPILIQQGMLDDSATPDRTACLVDELLAAGATVQVCTISDADHFDIVERTVGFGVEWAVALAGGSPLPACAASELPPCN